MIKPTNYSRGHIFSNTISELGLYCAVHKQLWLKLTSVEVVNVGLPSFHFPNPGKGSGAGPPADVRPGVSPPENFWISICDLVHFYAIWWQLFVGCRTRYICSFAIKTELICQLQCPCDCTAVLPLLSNEHALKSGTFGVPGLVLLERGTTWHKSGMGDNPKLMSVTERSTATPTRWHSNWWKWTQLISASVSHGVTLRRRFDNVWPAKHQEPRPEDTSAISNTDQLKQHTHTRSTTLCPGLPRWAGTRKVKPIWILLKPETVSGSGISWAIWKSASRSRQITMPAPHCSVFTGRMPFLPPNQKCQSTEGRL